jgi:hypothetical protein
MGQHVPGEYSAEMLERYAFLRAFVKQAGDATLLHGLNGGGVAGASAGDTAEDAEAQAGWWLESCRPGRCANRSRPLFVFRRLCELSEPILHTSAWSDPPVRALGL